ncbi:MAG: hypothetical protein HQ579_01510 [Candidatus Omnitrophica bacterium]|nr:hypothetical protein [Candidatus Omnitrophota bacterium]
MTLFDDIARDYDGPALYNEPKFAYYNRSNREAIGRIRHLLEEWFLHYPVDHQTELRSKFRSDINAHHYSAFFELIIYELLLRLNYKVTIHPDIDGSERKPDFLAESSKCESFYIEAVLATDKSAREIAEEARMGEVYDALNRMESPNFFIEMEIIGAPKTPPSAKKIKAFLANQLKHLNPDDIAALWQSDDREKVPHWNYEHDGWKIIFYPIPKSPKGRSKPGSRPIGVILNGKFSVLDSHSAIRDTIIAKANRYGKLEWPYVIAVNALGEDVKNIDIMNALFGEEQIVANFGWGPKKHKHTRARNGVWIGEPGIQYTGISAILIAHPLLPYNIPKAPIRLYHNPWARKKYSSNLTCLPQSVPQENRLEPIEGKPLGAIFNLSPEWPG